MITASTQVVDTEGYCLFCNSPHHYLHEVETELDKYYAKIIRLNAEIEKVNWAIAGLTMAYSVEDPDAEVSEDPR